MKGTAPTILVMILLILPLGIANHASGLEQGAHGFEAIPRPNATTNSTYDGPSDRYGVKLHMDPGPIAALMFILDGDLKKGTFSVTNTGTVRDTVRLTLSFKNNPREEGWNAWLSEKEIVLDPGQTRDVLVFVHGPFIDHMDYLTVTIVGSSEGNPGYFDTIIFKTFTCVCFSIVLDLPDTVHHIQPEGNTTYRVNIYVNDIGTVKLSLEGTIDWNFSLNRTEIPFHYAGNNSVLLTVKGPAYALPGEVGDVKIKAAFFDRFEYMDIQDEVSTFTMITPAERISTEISSPIRPMEQGRPVKLNVTINNTGNVPEDLTVELKHPLDWSVTPSSQEIKLGAFSKRTLQISIVPTTRNGNAEIVGLALRVHNANRSLDEVSHFEVQVEPIKKVEQNKGTIVENPPIVNQMENNTASELTGRCDKDQIIISPEPNKYQPIVTGVSPTKEKSTIVWAQQQKMPLFPGVGQLFSIILILIMIRKKIRCDRRDLNPSS